MKSSDRARLIAALRDHVAKIAADLRAKVSSPGDARTRAQQLHADEQVAEDFDVWTDLVSRRAAVLWVLKSVYVRVLEDRGLLSPGRLFDLEAQQLFERLAPHLGETAFLRWVYHDLESPHGGLPELFSAQPAEVALPSDELSRSLIAFWRHSDADTGGHWSFSEERFEGELMGDLYQELDPVVKDRFALCQTPDFVRTFILDRTLTPALETFGGQEVRLLDPACGSGHFLIDGLKRLVAATAANHPEWERGDVVAHALNRVVGVDLNDYACALARARLIMTAAELAGVKTLAGAAPFHPHVYWADGLEQAEREETEPAVQCTLFKSVGEKPRATLTRADVRLALRNVLAPGFHAVVANPPYIVEGDESRRAYHKERVRGCRRYVSAHGQYHLSAPFTERCFQLAVPEGFVGIIVDDQFMKRSYGKPLVEKVLAQRDLRFVADTSQAFIPHHGTPTVLIFARNGTPSSALVRVAMGKRGETGTPTNPAEGRVWSSIRDHWHQLGFENDYVTVVDVPREELARHPWNLRGGGVAALKRVIEKRAGHRLSELIEPPIGRASRIALEDVFIAESEIECRRRGLTPAHMVRHYRGAGVRDWYAFSEELVWFPYGIPEGEVVVSEDDPDWAADLRSLWPWRTALAMRATFQGVMADAGLRWFEYMQFTRSLIHRGLQITFANVCTHNQFAVVRGRHIFNSKAPVIKLPPTSDERAHFEVLGALNSSTLGFWMRQVFQPKGGESTGKKRQSEPWSRRLEFDGTKLRAAPVPSEHRERIAQIAAALHDLAQQASRASPGEVLSSDWEAGQLRELLLAAKARSLKIRAEMVAWQEELDWTTYAAFGLLEKEQLVEIATVEALESEHRPFAIRLARDVVGGRATGYWFDALGLSPQTEVPHKYTVSMRQRIESRLALIESNAHVRLLETPEYKRKWEPIQFDRRLGRVALRWLADCLERVCERRLRPSTVAQLAAAVQDDSRFLEVASIYQGRRDVDLGGLIQEVVSGESVPNHPFHVYTSSGQQKHRAWEAVWALQSHSATAATALGANYRLPEYSQGSRGKSTDYLRGEFWALRGKLDVPKERFIAFTEVPGRAAGATLYGWAGWTATQRLKVILAIDEDLEDSGVPLVDRVGLLDGAWRLLPGVGREDPAAATRLKAELQSLLGMEGPSGELLEDWKKRFPPPTARAARIGRTIAALEDESDNEESDGL